MFVEDMSSGRGIAIVANLLDNLYPRSFSSLLFGFVTSLSFRFKVWGGHLELTEMLPYYY